MKVLRLHGVCDLRIHDEPEPLPRVGEECLRVTSVGVCGSDLHWFSEAGIGDAHIDQPLVLGHEFAGVTAAGLRVAADPAIPCQKCEYCEEGNPNFCLNLHFAGHGKDDGALRQQVAWPSRCLFPIPDSISDADGAMLEPLGVAIHAVDLGHVKPGMRVGVFGCGPIGLLVLQVARAAGATELIATDLLPHRLEAARACGATRVIQASPDGSEAAEVLAATGGRGVHVAFEAAGVNAAFETGIAAARGGGRVVIVGIPSLDTTSFSASVARRKGLTISLCRRMKLTYPRAIALVMRGLVDVRALVTHRFPLAQAAEAFATAERREGLKIVIEP
jgi:L-iditol 2-dehydrogenase